MNFTLSGHVKILVKLNDAIQNSTMSASLKDELLEDIYLLREDFTELQAQLEIPWDTQ